MDHVLSECENLKILWIEGCGFAVKVDDFVVIIACMCTQLCMLLLMNAFGGILRLWLYDGQAKMHLLFRCS